MLDRRDLLGRWWTELEIDQRQHALSGPQWARWLGKESLYEAFRLRPGEAMLAFSVQPWLPKSLRRVTLDADRVLRFCAECLQQGFHTELFQLPWWCRCPIHACTLHDQCPQCHTPVPMNLHLSMPFDPENAFHCPHCQMDFANNRAIVMAPRGEAVHQWHGLVGAHFRWRQAVDRAFVLAPRLRAQSRVTTQFMLDLLAATGVAWPPELEPHVARLGKASNLGIERSFGPSDGALPAEFPRIAELEIELGQNEDDCSIKVGQSECFPTSWAQAQVIVRLERRLSRESGQALPREFWDWLHKYRQREERTPWDPGLGQLQMDTPGFRDRGYRYRLQVMDVGTSSVGTTELTIIGSELSRLSAVRILRGLRAVLRNEALVEGSVEHDLLTWWYSHFLALALIDGTIGAIHVQSYFPLGSPRPHQLPGWPPVDLDRHSPGHDWAIAVIGRERHLSAYIMSVPTRSMTGDEVEVEATVRSIVEVFRVLQAEARRRPPNGENQK